MQKLRSTEFHRVPEMVHETDILVKGDKKKEQ